MNQGSAEGVGKNLEDGRLKILQMISAMQPLASTLTALSEAVVGLACGGKAAVLLVKSQRLTIGSASGFLAGDLDCIEGLPASRLTTGALRLPCSTADFAVRTVLSGAGELLGGILIGLAVAPAPRPEIEIQLQNLEGLTALAIEQSHLVEELNYRLEHDALTDVYDRLSIERRLSEAMNGTLGETIGESARCGKRIALIVIGIDRLRLVNSALGHRVGNELLRQAAQRLRRNCGTNAVVGRAGGDEFLVLIPHLSSTDAAGATAERLTDLLRMPFSIGDHELKVTATAGIGISSAEACQAQDIEARAYAALEYAKSLGGNQKAFFDCSMVSVSPEYLELETRLRGALGGRELLLYYQPQLALNNYSTVGVEALLRWRHPDLGLISPCSFIPMAEEGGLISEIGEWALEEGLRQLAAWKRLGMSTLRMGINVSPLQFRRRNFTRRVLELVDRSGSDTSELLLEITEGTVMQDFDYAVAQINRLRDAGIRFAIDDFGTGYSSLSYLQKLPADQIKIDLSFVQEIEAADDRPPLLENILRLASELGIAVIAEGIETQEQADALAAMGCHEGQGFLFSRPLPGIEITSWLRGPGVEPGL
jgi:diguanylate cyclase (GGDEF)-like protein